MPGPWVLRSNRGFWNERIQSWGGFSQATKYTALRSMRPLDYGERPRFQTIDLARRQMDKMNGEAAKGEKAAFAKRPVTAGTPDTKPSLGSWSDATISAAIPDAYWLYIDELEAEHRSGSQVDIDDLTTDLRNEFDDWLNGSSSRNFLADESFDPSQIDWHTGHGWRIIERDEY